MLLRRMQIEPRPSQPLPAEWTGARLVVEKWLARRCVVESLLQLVGGMWMLLAGLVALALTSGVAAFLIFFLVLEINGLFAAAGVGISLMRPVLFAGLFILFMALSVIYAWRTRRETSAAARVIFDSSFSSLTNLALEFFSAGPIFMVLAAQDFHKFARLSRADVPQLSAVLLWLYDKNSRAGFAEISLAFPGLNAVRVLPQLRDLSGIYWWPEEGEIALSEELQKTLAEVLGRGPKNFPAHGGPARESTHFKSSAPGISDETLSWYTTLNLPPFATLQQVKTRYRKLAKIHHPDARARNRPAGEPADDGQMKRINEAYHNILKHSQNQAGSFN
jgi:DnaJ-domain-containing protein 1